MVLEKAHLYVRLGQQARFEADFAKAGVYISSIEGYLEHSLHRCLEIDNKYLLLVKWQTLEAHTIGFRQSVVYQEWKALLHHYYEPFPMVEHYQLVIKRPS